MGCNRQAKTETKVVPGGYPKREKGPWGRGPQGKGDVVTAIQKIGSRRTPRTPLRAFLESFVGDGRDAFFG